MEGTRKGRRIHWVTHCFDPCPSLFLTSVTLRSYPDKTRGVLNEGGLFGERQGWHLPGFDTSRWVKRDLGEGLPSGGAGVGFFVTTFDLDIPRGLDAMLSFEFEPLGQPYRAILFVNGWHFGKVGV